MSWGFFAVLGLASLHTTHNFVGIILNLSPLEYKYNLSQNMLQDDAILLQLVELLWINGQDITQGQKPFIFWGPFISGTIPANISIPVSLSSSLMMEGSEPPLREACFHVITKADEISLKDLNSLFGRLKLYLSSPRNEA